MIDSIGNPKAHVWNESLLDEGGYDSALADVRCEPDYQYNPKAGP